jgi:hypothetical protein
LTTGRIDIIEQLVQRPLRMAERALDMGIVATPHHIVPTQAVMAFASTDDSSLTLFVQGSDSLLPMVVW